MNGMERLSGLVEAEENLKSIIQRVADKMGMELSAWKRPQYTLGGAGYRVVLGKVASSVKGFKKALEDAGLTVGEPQNRDGVWHIEVQPTVTDVTSEK